MPYPERFCGEYSCKTSWNGIPAWNAVQLQGCEKNTPPRLRWAKKDPPILDGSIAQIQSVHFQGFLCCKPVVIWCKLSAESRVHTVILPCAPAISPAASLSGNYDLNGQRSASRCWPSAVAQQRLNRPRLKVCDSLLFTILSLAHALAYVAYSAQYRLHLRLVRTGLPFTYSL